MKDNAVDLEELVDDLVRYCNTKEKVAFNRSGRNDDSGVRAYNDVKNYLQENVCTRLRR